MCDFIENINFIVASSDLKIQNSFWNQPVSLNIIKPWSVTCPSTMDSTQKMEFKQVLGDTTKIDVKFCYILLTYDERFLLMKKCNGWSALSLRMFIVLFLV